MAGPLYHIYCDESSTSGHLHMAIGGLMMSEPLRDTIDTAMVAWKCANGLGDREIKWCKTGKGTLRRYKSIVSAAMGRIDKQEMAFRSVVFPSSELDHKAFNDGDAEVGNNKFLYDLLFFCLCPLVPRDARILIFVDKQHRKHSLTELQRILNLSLVRRLHFTDTKPVRSIEPRCSKEEILLQVNDILLGAVGYHANGRELRADASPERKELAMHVASLAGIPHLRTNTPPRMTHFGVWLHQLKKEHPSS